MHNKNRIYPVELMESTLAKYRGWGRHRIPAVAAELLCADNTVRAFLRQKERERKRKFKRTHPEPVEIELALHQTAGNVMAAARLLGCTENWVVTYVREQRANGREIGRRGAGRRKEDFLPAAPVSEGVQIAVPIDDTLPPVPLTEQDRQIIALTETHFAAELESAA